MKASFYESFCALTENEFGFTAGKNGGGIFIGHALCKGKLLFGEGVTAEVLIAV